MPCINSLCVQVQSVGRGGRWNLRDLVDLLWACARLNLPPQAAVPLAQRLLDVLPRGELLLSVCDCAAVHCMGTMSSRSLCSWPVQAAAVIGTSVHLAIMKGYTTRLLRDVISDTGCI